MEHFITEIEIKKVRHLENLTIKLSDTERKHLILTGKNGSGKTSVLEVLKRNLVVIQGNLLSKNKKTIIKNNQAKIDIANVKNTIFSFQQFSVKNFIFAYFHSTENRTSKPIIPKNPNKLTPFLYSSIEDKNISAEIVQYLVNLHFKKLNAINEKDEETAIQIDAWFANFTKMLQSIFQDDSVQLKFDIDNMNFNILTKGREKFDFTTLSDGYSAFLNIVTEIILRMESKAPKVYDIQGIVLIDEIETHLHIDLQEKILPLLTTFFPKIQFIVTTHSPFVLSSISNSVIYDLENHSYLTDVSDLSYSALIKYHFRITDEYSILIKHKIADYQGLIEKKERTETENKQLFDLDTELSNLSPVLSPELYLQFTQLQEQLA